MAARRARYTEEYIANALVRLAANGGNVCKTARELGINEATLRHWKKGNRAPEIRQVAALKMRPAAEDCERIAVLLLNQIESKVDTSNLVGTSTAFGIMLDKAGMLRAAAPPEDGEQPIDLSKLSPERLEILNGWLAESNDPTGDPSGAGS